MSGPITENYEAENVVSPSRPRDFIHAGDDSHQEGFGNPRITIDLGKSVNSIAICAALCGICVAVTIGTVWHSNERETETQAQIRVLKNHIDDAYNKLAIIEGRRHE